MKLINTASGIFLDHEGEYFHLPLPWDEVINRSDLHSFLKDFERESSPTPTERMGEFLMPPIGSQEIWASGVTYLRSREARMEESKEAGGDDFYERVYDADRPELFFKAGSGKAVGSGQKVRIRKDANWNVPEPEFTLVINSQGEIIGYTIGNDMSSRDIEGENPLYLPQAKTYDGSAAIGPCLWVPEKPMSSSTTITLEILRKGQEVFKGETSVNQMKRKFDELVSWLFKEMSFPTGVYLMTGTGIIPPNDFSLQEGDVIRIQVKPIGILENVVSR
ncbi:MAG: fumarylacetoacetate hydrolase family protein [Bacteroidota bacterium]